jgi:hypothetical protein
MYTFSLAKARKGANSPKSYSQFEERNLSMLIWGKPKMYAF